MPTLLQKQSTRRLFFQLIFFLLLISCGLYSIITLSKEIQKASAAEVSPLSQFVSANGKNLYLNGERYQFTGVNAFNLGTYPGANAGCGSTVADLDSFFSKLRPNAMVRMWAFQGSITTNVTTKQIDWTGLDRVVNAAQKNGKKLILVLGDQSGACDDGHWKDKSWYLGGYKQVFNDYGNGMTPLPYLDYVKRVVTRYKDSPVIAMWEPVNEPAASDCTNGKGYTCYSYQVCPDETSAANAMRTFFDTVGGTIKSIDTNHLVSSGVIGDGQCGTIFEDYKYVHSSSGIDVASYHDYQRDDQPMPGDEWNGLKKRLDQMSLINKPLIIGEVGMLANTSGAGCMNLTSRRDKIKAKMDAQFSAGITGFLPWSLTLGVDGICNYDIIANDPLIPLLHDYPVLMSSVLPTTTITNAPYPTPTPTPVDTQPPSIPLNLKASGITSSQVTISWSASTDNIGVARYDIFRNYSYVTSVTGTTYTNSGLSPHTSYMYYVKAKDTTGNYSPASAQLTIATLYIGPSPTPTSTPKPTPTPMVDTQPPSIPTNLTASTLTSNQVTLSWSAATDNVGVARYDIFRNYSYVTSVTGTRYTHTGLSPSTSYMYYIKAKDTSGNYSAASSQLSLTTLSVGSTPGADTESPTVPTNLKATSSSSTQVTLTWTAATDNVGVARYEIYRDYTYITATTGTSFTNSSLSPGKTYMYYLKTRDTAGNSSGSSMQVQVTTPL